MFPVDKKRQFSTPPSPEKKNREMLSGGVLLQKKCYLLQKICQKKMKKKNLRPFPDEGMFDEMADEIGENVVSCALPALSSSSSSEFLCHRSAFPLIYHFLRNCQNHPSVAYITTAIFLKIVRFFLFFLPKMKYVSYNEATVKITLSLSFGCFVSRKSERNYNCATILALLNKYYYRDSDNSVTRWSVKEI
ncbi:hypothetical protein NPIL_228501 [Nephila pilipes]|uniref:Uncharacterized protein n=1 Tax=Nephila pilipes TaxID=299642 RepID=A0A8X6TZ93_NEPPI|nr:hypothetical protein NPIL_228501 [Nephila pilipes]